MPWVQYRTRVLHLYDTATGSVTELVLREPGKVSMYVCGPTVYDVPHLGHGRFTLVFDILRRYLEWSGLEVVYVSNITDVDDKIIAQAKADGTSTAEVAERNEEAWWAAMAALGVKVPTETPHATAYIPQMIALVERLVASGDAYQTSDGVYLEVSRVPGYGLLARQPLDSLRAGARVATADEKRTPLDFALWKLAKPDEPSWPSPFGAGRPGWHTECVVMALDLLHDGFDLHGGGADLAFPHHENERAQAVALGRSFARHWCHNGWVVDASGEKMSKSLGNFTSLTDLLAHTDGRAYRLIVARSDYRQPLLVTPETMADAERALVRLDTLARRASNFGLISSVPPDRPALSRFAAAMDDDLDTPAATAGIFDLARAANSAFDSGQVEAGRRLAATVVELAGALGLVLRGDDQALDPVANELVRRRDEARASRDFASADRLRAQLEAMGWVVEDTASGTQVRRPAG
ncbi:MAG: cysteine--tRNA ligase [Acidimicrobiales bacterium]